VISLFIFCFEDRFIRLRVKYSWYIIKKNIWKPDGIILKTIWGKEQNYWNANIVFYGDTCGIFSIWTSKKCFCLLEMKLATNRKHELIYFMKNIISEWIRVWKCGIWILSVEKLSQIFFKWILNHQTWKRKWELKNKEKLLLYFNGGD